MTRYITLVLLLFPFFIFSQEVDFSKIPQLQTKATYTTEVTPDKITLSIVLTENNTKGKISVEELEKKLETVLIANNVDIKTKLKLVTLSSNFKNSFLKKTDVYKTKRYELEINEAKQAGQILKDLESNQISNVNLSKTEYSKLEELKIELKGKAVLKAKKQAKQMAKALDQKLGKAIFISDLETNISRYRQDKLVGLNMMRFGSANELKQKQGLDIDFNKIRINVLVTVYFKLE